MYHCWSY